MGATWGGCVEERPDPYLVTDERADPGKPDTPFVPYLWPDEGDVQGDGAPQLPSSSGKGNGNGWGNGNGNGYCAANWQNASTGMNNYLYDFGGVCAVTDDAYEAADVADAISQGSGATKICKYKGATGVSSSVASNGPNYNCIKTQLMTLTQDTQALTARVNSMNAGGDTNLLPGFMWGWRSISPNGPLGDQAIAPKSYTSQGNTKAIVFMTDGFNNWASNPNYAYKSKYNALGYYVDNRLQGYGGATHPTPSGGAGYSGSTNASNWRQQMDAALLAACANAKAAGVIVYTVGFSILSDPIDSEGLALLRSCATDSAHAFIAQDGNALVAAFGQIGTGLGKIKLTK